jgi:hypothetical protein
MRGVGGSCVRNAIAIARIVSFTYLGRVSVYVPLSDGDNTDHYRWAPWATATLTFFFSIDFLRCGGMYARDCPLAAGVIRRRVYRPTPHPVQIANHTGHAFRKKDESFVCILFHIHNTGPGIAVRAPRDKK